MSAPTGLTWTVNLQVLTIFTMTLPLVLASSSPYRRLLLQRLQLPFVWASPDIDETPLVNENVQTMTLRLATAKAQACFRIGAA